MEESLTIKKMRQKLQKRLNEQEQQLTPQALKWAAQVIEQQIKKRPPEKAPFKKIVELLPEEHPLPFSPSVLHLKESLKEELFSS